MTNIDLEKNGIYNLPVKEVRAEDYKLYYIVENGGKEYAVRQLKFQKGEPVPETISCLVRDVVDGEPVIVQNFEPFLRSLYRVGEVYQFWVRRSLVTPTGGCYEVADWNGFFFRVQVNKKTKLYIRQRVECKVTKIDGSRLYLKLVQGEKEEDSRSSLLLDVILEEVEASPAVVRWLKRLFWHSPIFAEVRKALGKNDGNWAMMSIGLLESRFAEWITPGGKHNGLLLDLYCKVCLYLLEDSDLLKKIAEKRAEHVQLLSQAIARAEEHREAVRLLASAEHADYVDAIFSKVKKSGYLYDSEKKLKVLACMFWLDPALLKQKIQELSDIILNGDPKDWFAKPYHDFIVRTFEMYVEEYRTWVEHIGRIECEDDERNLKSVIVALAILLLLTENEGYSAWLSWRSMLYRCLTYMKGSSAEVLMKKAFLCLADGIRQKLEYGWKDIKELALFVARLSYPLPERNGGEVAELQYYEGVNARLSLQDGAVRLSPAGNAGKLHACLPDWLLPWHGLQVMLPDTVGQYITRGTKELVNYQKLWKEIEYALFSSTGNVVSKPEKRKIKPDVGDKVTIEVLRQDLQDPDRFFCRIEDDAFCGEGTLNVRDIVPYKLNADISAFCSDEGKRYLLQAEVVGMSTTGSYRFSLTRLLGAFIYQGVYVGEYVQCMVTDSSSDAYRVICNFGYSLTVPKTAGMPELVPGDYIEVVVSEVYSNSVILADYLRQMVETFHAEDAFANLIFSYADERVNDKEEEEEPEDNRRTALVMDDAHVCELMCIIDRVAMIEEDYIKTYNYLGYARMIAILLGKDELAEYYLERMKFMQLLQLFVINGQVDVKLLKERREACADMLARYPLLHSDLVELMVLSSLSYPEQNAFLWKIIHQGGNERREKLARLVLSYNLLDGFSMFKQREAMRSELDEVLNMDVGKHISYAFGREDQHREFKTSIVYPADNRMKPDLHRQTMEIMNTICGFLNADGGTLYLGVNNEGVACGLESDIEYFNGSLDKFDLHVRNSVVRHIGVEANGSISVSYPPAGNRLVYAMEIKPCMHPVMCDGVCYQRQGSSTWALLDEALDAFLKSREQKVARIEDDAPVPAAEMPLQQEESASAATEETTPEMPQETYSLSAKTTGKSLEPDDAVATSQIRANAVHSWTEGYGVGVLRYMHLLSGNSYMMTDDECWRNDILLSLAIHESEADGYLVIVFESGRVVRVSMNDLQDKKLDKEYKRYAQEKILFACPAHRNDALLTVVHDMQHRPCFRLDDVLNLKEGNMLAKGDFLSVVANTGVIQCDIIPAAKKYAFKHIHNMRPSQIGLNLTMHWGGEELKELEEMGIKL